MTKNPIDELLEEHVLIMSQIDSLRDAVKTLAIRGDRTVTELLPIFAKIGQMMATQLDLHRRKEDDVLFPAIEAIIGNLGPTGVMRVEHRDIHAQGVLLRETLRELHEEQHPLIEAEADKLRSLISSGGSAKSLRKTGEEIIYLLDLHFGKEEEILFPMARNLLDSDSLNRISEQFAELELTQINEGANV
jgi:regulator of cell morphogenesis and NO signaling